MDSLDLRFSKSILLKLYNEGSCLKTNLQDIVKNLYSLDKLLASLSKDELINIDVKTFGKNIQEISLTPKGRSVAEQLKRIEEMAKEEPVIQISDQEARDWAARFREATKGMSLLYHVNVYQDHVSIGYDIAGKNRITNVYVRVNGKGIMRLWCEEDESFECIHVQYAWTLPKVQEMYANNVKNGNVQDNGERR